MDMDKVRRYDLDWLRVFGVFLVVIFHSLMIFILESWAVVYIKDTEYIHSFKKISSIIYVFNMPLLFIIAGMAVSFSLRTRSSKQFVMERIKKLLVPAVFGCILINPIMTYIYVVSTNKSISFFEHLTRYFTKNPGDFSGVNGGFTPAQLWFIIFLFVFSLVCLPVFIKLRKTEATAVLDKISIFLSKPYVVLCQDLAQIKMRSSAC